VRGPDFRRVPLLKEKELKEAGNAGFGVAAGFRGGFNNIKAQIKL